MIAECLRRSGTSPWRRPSHAIELLLVVVCIASCTTGASSPSAGPPTARTAQTEDLLIVDCMLPPQIRRLGERVTYLTPPRPAKTSARDCRQRGGEYVENDRANYASALKIWLPKAKEGDVEAQTNVGEIFEKGLGVPADYTAAAEWYRRAATAGSSRAAINLGALYAQGLGVPKDPAQAREWYRRAAGVTEVRFDVSAPNTAPAPTNSAETQRLRQEVTELRRQLEAKQQELERTQRELDGLRRTADQRRTEVDAERAAVARLRQELDARRNTDQAGSTRVRELERAVAEREGRLAAKDRELAEIRATLAQQEAAVKAQHAAVDQLQKKAAETGPEIYIIEPQLVVSRDVQPMKAVATSDSVLIVGRVTAPAGIMSVTVNGREEKLEGDSLFKARIPVRKQSEERVRIAAVDRNGRRATLEFVVVDHREMASVPSTAPAGPSAAPAASAARVGFRPPREPLRLGTYYALVIGNNNYAQLPKLKTAVNDARELARVLEKEYGFKVTLLVDANRYDMLNALNDMRQRLTEKDNLLIYYAGHGTLDQKNQRGHWLPVDAEPNSSTNWISNVAVSDILNAMTVQQLLVVADSCYSGTLTRSALAQLDGGLSEEERLRVIRLMAQKRSRMAMTSGGLEPVIDGTGPHSVFAALFIELLRANAGVLPGYEMFQLLRARVAAGAAQLDVRQVPEYAPIKFAGHESGDFVFVRAN